MIVPSFLITLAHLSPTMPVCDSIRAHYGHQFLCEHFTVWKHKPYEGRNYAMLYILFSEQWSVFYHQKNRKRCRRDDTAVKAPYCSYKRLELAPRIHIELTAGRNFNRRESDNFFWLLQEPAHTHTHMHTITYMQRHLAQSYHQSLFISYQHTSGINSANQIRINRQ